MQQVVSMLRYARTLSYYSSQLNYVEIRKKTSFAWFHFQAFCYILAEATGYGVVRLPFSVRKYVNE